MKNLIRFAEYIFIMIVLASMVFSTSYRITATDDLRINNAEVVSDGSKSLYGHDGGGTNNRVFIKFGNLSWYGITETVSDCILSMNVANVFTDAAYDFSVYSVTANWTEGSTASINFNGVRGSLVGNTTHPSYSVGAWYNVSLSASICTQWLTGNNYGVEMINFKGESYTVDDHELQFNDIEAGISPRLYINTIILPVVSLVAPVNNTRDNAAVNFTFRPDFNTSDNCTLYGNFGGSWAANQTVTSAYSDRNNSFNYLVSLSDASYIWNVKCNSTYATGNYTLTIDTTSPSITFNPSNSINVNNQTQVNKVRSNVTINFTLDHAASSLYAFETIFSYAANSSQISYINASLNTTSYTYSTVLDISRLPYGNYTYQVSATDSHTNKNIPDYQVSAKKSSITFKTEYENNIKVETRELSTITALKINDRYRFSMSFDDGLTKTRVFDVKADCPIEYLPYTIYRAHFVSSCNKFKGGNWIDFEGAGNLVSVRQYDDYHFSVELQNVPATITFNSIGGLNRNTKAITFNINAPPSIIGNYPVANNFSASENTTVLFNVTVSDVDSFSFGFRWLLDGVVQAITSAWSWTLSFLAADFSNPHNVTVYVNDTTGNEVSYTWNVSAINVNIPTTLSSFTITPSVTTINNQLITAECEIIKDAVTNITVNISYRLPSNVTWQSVNVGVDAVSGKFTGNVTTQISNAWLGYMSWRCAFNDSGNVSGSITNYNSVYVNFTNVDPYTPDILTPGSGNYDTFINGICEGADFNDDTLYYDVQAQFTDIDGVWRNWSYIALNSSTSFFSWNIINLPAQSNIHLRCRSFDGLAYSDWLTSSASLSVVHGLSLAMTVFTKSYGRVPYNNIGLGLLCDVSNLYNSEIYATWADCNNDGQFDYIFKYSNYTGSIKKVFDHFKCVYSDVGNYTVKVGCITSKLNSSVEWDKGLCSQITESDDYCNTVKSYEVNIHDSIAKID